MSIWPWSKKKEEPLDRQKFFAEMRTKLLENHGLPPDTPPDQTEGLLRVKKLIDRLNSLSQNQEKPGKK